jgi:hypothetical protein
MIVGIEVGKSSVEVVYFDGDRGHTQPYEQSEASYAALCASFLQCNLWHVFERRN